MSGEYVPTTEEVRALFATGNRAVNDGGGEWYSERDANPFDRWLAAHDATVRDELRKKIAAEILSHQGEIAAGTWYSAITYAARIAEGTT